MTPDDRARELEDLARVFDDLARAAWNERAAGGRGDRAHQCAGLATAYTRAAGMARYLADNPNGYAGAIVPDVHGADGKGAA